MTKAKIDRMPAAQAYGVRTQEVQEILKGLQTDLANSLVDPQGAHWGNIGDLDCALSLAQQLRDMLRREVK